MKNNTLANEITEMIEKCETITSEQYKELVKALSDHQSDEHYQNFILLLLDVIGRKRKKA